MEIDSVGWVVVLVGWSSVCRSGVRGTRGVTLGVTRNPYLSIIWVLFSHIMCMVKWVLVVGEGVV